jgi:endosialidase-like protein
MSNTEGTDNTASGVNALSSNITGTFNTAYESEALSSNIDHNGNTAIGDGALADNTAGFNTAVGTGALHDNTTGISNTALGASALGNNTTGSENTALGLFALIDASGSNNIGIGNDAGANISTASHIICIGADGANVDDSCYIGNIWQQPGGVQAVYVDSTGKLGAQVSSRRFKKDIKPMEQSSEVVYRLKPVSFRYKPEIESTGRPRLRTHCRGRRRR